MTSLSPSLPPFPSRPSSKALQSPPKKPHLAVSLLQISRTHGELSQIHALLVKTALIQEKHAFGRLLLSFASLSQPASLSHARKLFKTPDCPQNPFIYNSLIKCYSRTGDPRSALLLFRRMFLENSVPPDDFTYTFVCNACSEPPFFVMEGKQIHGLMVKSSIPIKTQSWNSLMDFYINIGEDLVRIRRIFDEMDDPDVVSWNCLLDGCVKSGDLDSARKLFDEMPRRDTVSWTTILVGYANAGLVSEARRFFDEMPNRSMISWSAMINGYLKSGKYQEALTLFEEMQASRVRIDQITLTTLLSSCAKLGALDQGQWIHSYINRNRIKADAHLCTALVDMYAKCGQLDLAYKVFKESEDKKVFLWNAMLGGLAMHSQGKRAIELFFEMSRIGTKPNEITFICVLSACSHSGLVDDGLWVFSSMERDYEITPTVEHYGCVVDLLGRAGLLDDARRVIEMMPIAADANVWRALLGACRVHENVELGEEAGRILLELEPSDDGNYVLLSNVYAQEKRWEDVRKLRRMMKEKGVRKTPGCSSMEVDGVVHVFVAGDQSHPQSEEIYSVLTELTNRFVFKSRRIDP